MKIRAMVSSCLAGGIILCMSYQYSRAQTEADKPPLKTGVVSIQRIFRDCERSKSHEKEMRAEEDKINAELNLLKKKYDAAVAGLGTLTRESVDYLELDRNVLREQDRYESQKRYYEGLLALKDRQWTKGLYRDILRVTGEVAKEKGLDLVFERTEPDFSMVSAAELLLTIKTHKLLYSAGCADITEQVRARLDQEKSKAKDPG
ncbi:MAG: OmpH/Skp family outer membrane protein [Planctomycetota bacterium]